MKNIFLIAAISCSVICKAQTAEDSVKTVVNKLFTAMKTANGRLLQSCFAEKAILQTIVQKNDSVQVQTDTVKDFADFVSKTQQNDADERITFDIVKTDGPLAVVWAPYNFFWKGKFSHCGIDAFQLVRINGEWKIQYLIDTRRKEGCKGI